MGLARGVVIKPVSVAIPKLGLPLEQIGSKIQEYQQIKDMFDAMADLSPKALDLKGDQELKSKYNQYVSKISQSVADSLAKGDAQAAARMMKAAKQQVAREWKEGGVAAALGQRADAYTKGIQEINAREIGEDYTEENKVVDLYDFKQSLKSIDYDLETGGYNKIGAPKKSTYTDLLSKAKEFAEGLGITKEAFVRYAQDYNNNTLSLQEYVHRKSIDESKVRDRLKLFLADDRVQRQMQISQKYQNIKRGLYDNPQDLIDTAAEYVKADIQTGKKSLQNYDKLPDIDKLKVLAVQGFINPTSTELKPGNPSFDKAEKAFKQSINDNINESKNKVLDVNTSENIIFQKEIGKSWTDAFLGQFGIEDSGSLLSDSNTSASNRRKNHEDIEKTIAVTAPAVEREINLDDVVSDSGDIVFNQLTDFNSFLSATDLDDDIKDALDIDLEDRDTNKSEKDYDETVKYTAKRIQDLLEIRSIIYDNTTDENTKVQELATKASLTTEQAKKLYDFMLDSKELDVQIVNASETLARHQRILDYYNTANAKASDNLKAELFENGESGKVKYKQTEDYNIISLRNRDFAFDTQEEAGEFIDLLNKVQTKITKGLTFDQLSQDEEFKKLQGFYKNYMFGMKPLKDSRNVYPIGSNRDAEAKRFFNNVDNFKDLIKPITSSDIQGDGMLKALEITTEYNITDEGSMGLSVFKDDIMANLRSEYLIDHTTNIQFEDEVPTVDGETVDKELIDFTKVDKGSIFVGVDSVPGSDLLPSPYVKFTTMVEDEPRTFKIAMPERVKKQFSGKLLEQGILEFASTGNEQGLVDAIRLDYKLKDADNTLTIGKALDQLVVNAAEPKDFTARKNVTKDGQDVNDFTSAVLMQTSANVDETNGNLKLHKVPYANQFRYYITFSPKGIDEERILNLPVAQQVGDSYVIAYGTEDNVNTYQEILDSYLLFIYDNLIQKQATVSTVGNNMF